MSVGASHGPIGSPKSLIFDNRYSPNAAHDIHNVSSSPKHSDKPASDEKNEGDYSESESGYVAKFKSPEIIAGSSSGSNASSSQQVRPRKSSSGISKPFAATSSVLGFGTGTPETSSIRAVKSLRGSDTGTIEAIAKGSAGTNENRASDLSETSRPRARSVPTSAEDSNSGKNLGSRSLSIGSHTIASTGTKMEKALRRNFLPRFLRTRKRGAIQKEKHAIEQAMRQKGWSGPNRIFFGAKIDDSAEEGRAYIIIQDTKKPTFRRPVYVDRNTLNMVDLIEMLKTWPGEDNAGSPLEKSTCIKTKTVDSESEDDKTDGTSEIPKEPTEQEAGHQPGNMDIPNRGSASDTAGSLDPQPAAPTRKRTVTFPLPPNVEVKPEHRFLRQSVVCTPYPHKYKNTKQRDETAPEASSYHATVDLYGPERQ